MRDDVSSPSSRLISDMAVPTSFYIGTTLLDWLANYEELGSRKIGSLPPLRDAQAEVKYSSTSRPCCRRLVTTVKILSTNRLPLSLCVPNDFRRQSTARRKGRSALLLVGSTPSSRTKVHNETSCLSRFSQVRRVLAWSQATPL